MLAFDMAREARIAQKETDVISMDQKLYELEVERTKNLGNMTSALLMLASSMDSLTRYFALPSSPSVFIAFTLIYPLSVLLYGWHYGDEPDNLRGPLWPCAPLAGLCPRLQVPLALEA